MTLCGYVVCRFVFVREWDFIGFILSPIVLVSLFGFGVWMGMKESKRDMKEEDGFKVWNDAGDAYYDEVVDEAVPLSFNAMKVVKDGKIGVIDFDLNLVLFGDFEDVTLPIDDYAFVKLDGDWKLIKIK